MKYLRLLNAKTKAADLYIFGSIGASFWDDSGITDIMVAEALAELDGSQELNVHIDSGGGDAAMGIAIYNLLANYPGNVRTITEGWAASAASVILQAGDERIVAANGLVMVHQASGFAMGNKVEMRKLAEILDKLDGTLALTYAARSGKDQAIFAEAMANETWYTAVEAKAYGLSDSILAAKAPADSSVEALRAVAIAQRPRFAAQYKNSPKGDDVEREMMRMRLALARAS